MYIVHLGTVLGGKKYKMSKLIMVYKMLKVYIMFKMDKVVIGQDAYV